MSDAHASVAQEKKQVIVPTGRKMGWLDARELVRTQGGLPPNVLHDRYLVETKEWKQIRDLYPAWAREILVYPEKNGAFKKGNDVIDPCEDEKGRVWVFPAACMPEAAIGQKGVGLFIDPLSVEISDKRVVVLAEVKYVAILTPFIQNDGEVGKADKSTGMPLYVAGNDRQYLTDAQKRWLWRIDGIGVRPLVRVWSGVWSDGRNVYANGRRGLAFGVAGVSLAQAELEPLEITQAPEDKGLLVRGATPQEFNAVLGEVSKSVEDLETKLESVKKLLRTLEIKG